MKNWNPRPPTPSTMGDHDVAQWGRHLEGKRIALLVYGGIAAMKTPMLARALRSHGAKVVAYLSAEASKYVAPDALEWATDRPIITQLSTRSEHLSKAEPFDAYLVAPATYNTINKFRFGIADSTVTTTFASALGLMERGQSQIMIAPTMRGDMHNSVLQESLVDLQKRGVVLIPPRDLYGKHNIPDNEVFIAYVCSTLSRSPLKGRKILVTAGATPTPIDNVRCITNRFRGRLGIEIAKELVLRGADVRMIIGAGSVPWPSYIETDYVQDFDAYKNAVLTNLRDFQPEAGLFSAAVADYAPKTRFDGKIPSNGALTTLELVPTEKVIDLAQAAAPQMKMVSFKYQEKMTHEALFKIARERIERGHMAVVANLGDEVGPRGEQVAYLLERGTDPRKMLSKSGIALGLCDYLESKFV